MSEVPVPLRVFVAGATGVVGRALLPRLRERGHHVTALVRQAGRLEGGDLVDAVAVADMMDPRRLRRVVQESAPDVVVCQVTAFRHPDFDVALHRTSRLRDTGTRNLVSAAVSAGARRIIIQSMAAAYCPHGHDVLDEEAPLWTEAPGRWGEAVRAVAAMEEAVLTCPSIEGVALRYGALYGPRTWYAPGGVIHEKVRGSALPLVDDGVGLTSFTHTEDAAGVVLEMLAGGDPGAYNVVDNEPAESMEWLPAYARIVGGPAPVSLTRDQARTQLDWLTVHQLTEQRGATNFRLRETLGWRPAWPSWREGFASLCGLWPG
ncbi:NAD(P)-dependent oxidoreductase [Saccharopolyspora erythraea]|uniref:NAD-dependent epimerase/dehydratase family protein n=1 Tax=Saccharopolyspora erythraea TaxID=1836 RepID=UPI001BEE91F9|nr:NAD(P)-dependent oxidoreductase [Saccharopolyspora erythraea]QUH02709.1 NAD(P)-dependent oxidoreductase [Saccharopolyspora erythraea]